MNDIEPAGTRVLQDYIELVLEIGLRVNAEHDLDRLLELTVQTVKDRLNYSYCAILLKEGTDLVIRAVTDYPETILGKRIPLGVGITGRCALSKVEALVPDLSRCPYYVQLGDLVFGSELDIPISFRGKVLGVLNTQSTQTNAFGPRDVHTLTILGTQLGVALHNAQIRNQLELIQDMVFNWSPSSEPRSSFPGSWVRSSNVFTTIPAPFSGSTTITSYWRLQPADMARTW
jgi:GAF domain-containing protein